MKRKLRYFLILVLALSVMLNGCTFFEDLFGGSSSSGSSNRRKFKETEVKIETTETVTNEGGEFSLPESCLLQATVSFIGASVDRAVTVQLGTVTGEYSNAPDTISPIALFISLSWNGPASSDTSQATTETSQATSNTVLPFENLSQPMEITMKYADNAEDAQKIPVAMYIDDYGNMLPMTTKCINQKEYTFTFLTYHASTYTFYLLENLDSYADEAATSFIPSEDGFSEKNQGSSAFSGGECYGMSSFAKWYFLNKKSPFTGGLFSKFQSPQMGTSPTGDIIVPQDIVATKAFQYTTDQASILWSAERQFSSFVHVDDDGNESYSMDNSVSIRCIMDAITFWEEPVEVGIYGSAGHSVLAYKYEKTDSEISIYIYDPNFPGDDNQKIVYNVANKTISTPSYDAGFLDQRLTTTGYGTFSSVNQYEQIYQDALNGFADSAADVEITSPTNGAEVDTGTVVMTGTVDTLAQMGEQIGDIIEIVTEDGQIFRQYLTKYDSSSSYFSIEIPVESGQNMFLINTIYIDENGSERYLANDMYGWFIINSTVAANAIYVTLTWDGQPDIDLYVTDPNGETSYYRNYYTSDGGVLDIDDTTGYGPEHWTLTTDNTVRWDQGYTVRLHYYEGDGPTSYTVKVVINQGTDRETVKTYSGVISTSNSSNDSPSATGSDWVDICIATPYTA